MNAFTRREVVGLAVVVAMGSRDAGAAEPLTPDAIVEKKFEGKTTVEFTVGDVGFMLTSRSTAVDESLPLQIAPKAVGKTKVYFLVSWEAATRLKRLGIDDLAAHFRGKVIRVSGTVERLDGPEYRMQVTSLDQFEVIRKP